MRMKEEPPCPEAFGDILRRYRAAAGLSKGELAARAGLSRRAVSDLERGVRRRPYLATVRRLAETLQLEAADRAALLAARPSPSPPAPRTQQRPRPALRVGERGRLPSQPTALIGRDREVLDLQLRLLRPEVRLLTLTGAGGCGTTRTPALSAATWMVRPVPAWMVRPVPVQVVCAVVWLRVSSRGSDASAPARSARRMLWVGCIGPPCGWAVWRRRPTSRPSFMSGQGK